MGLPQINPYQLINFYTVAKEGSFSAASKKLCVTQPAVTMQIKSLEKFYDLKLINVKKKKVYLTKIGEKLFHYAEKFCETAIKAETFLQEQKNNNLSIGVASPLTQQFIVLIKKFKQRNPHVMVTIREGTDEEILAAVRDFRLTLGFTGTVEQSVSELNVITIAPEHRLVLASFPQNPLACRKKVTWDDLEGCSLILHRKGMTGRNIILDAFKKNKINPVITAEIDSIEGMKNLIKQDAGIGLKFYPNVEKEILDKTLKIIPLEGDQMRIGIDAVFQPNIDLSKPSKSFLDIAVEHFNNLTLPATALNQEYHHPMTQ